MSKFNQKEYQANWDKENCKRLYLKLNKANDADIINRLDKEVNKQGYIKNLIRKDINR